MRDVLVALNALVAEGALRRYAIGGAIAASFYIEALQTEDVDAFVILPVSAAGLVSLSGVYEALKAQGGVVEREHVRFGAWPLQILTDANSLIVEAIEEAQEVLFGDVPTRVFTAEHLCAIALQTRRLKDKNRVQMFLEQSAVHIPVLEQIAQRFGLLDQLQKIKRLGDE